MLVTKVGFGQVTLHLSDQECKDIALALEVGLAAATGSVLPGLEGFGQTVEQYSRLETMMCLFRALGQDARDMWLGLDLRREIAEGWERGVDVLGEADMLVPIEE